MKVATNNALSVDPSTTTQAPTDDTRENLKKTLQDPNTSTPDAMAALHQLYMMDGKKMVQGNASAEEENEHRLIGELRSGKISDSDLEALGSQLGMSPERLAELNKQFQPKANHEPSNEDIK